MFMLTKIGCFGLLCFLVAPGLADEPDRQRVDDFSLYDHNGVFHQLSYYADSKAIVLFVQGNGCPIVRKQLPALKKLQATFEPNGVTFFLINSNMQDHRDSVAKEAADFQITMPILVDNTQLVGESLKLTRTAEALVIDPARMEIVYRGPIDNRVSYEAERLKASHTYLADALEAHLAGKAVTTARVLPRGCLISFEKKKKVTYTEHVAPLLKDRCQSCHQTGGVAPWAMTGYPMVKGWSQMIREVVRTKRMPPWHADPHIGTFSNAIELSNEERRLLVHWAEAGAPRGEGADPLLGLKSQVGKWSMGEPDLIITLPTQYLPAEGVFDYRYLPVTLPTSEDHWVRAVEFKAGNLAVTHHGIFIEAGERGIEDKSFREDIMASYVPGRTVERFPEGTGRLMRAGSSFYAQMHYTATGKKESDSSQIGFYFHDKKPEYVLLKNAAWGSDVAIPPGAPNHEERGRYRFSRDAILYSFWPHMHFRGKAMRYVLSKPDGSEETLMSVANYNFNWQRVYHLEQPIKIKAGSVLTAIGIFDNSARNPANPDPKAHVYFGEQTFDEMMIGYFSYRNDGPRQRRAGYPTGTPKKKQGGD